MFRSLKEFLQLHPDAEAVLDENGNKVTIFNGGVLYKVPKSSYIQTEEKKREEFLNSLEAQKVK